jgi:hypothetical protein
MSGDTVPVESSGVGGGSTPAVLLHLNWPLQANGLPQVYALSLSFISSLNFFVTHFFLLLYIIPTLFYVFAH